jgi:hypothetical protein
MLLLTALLLGGVEKLLPGAAVINSPFSFKAGMGSGCLCVGVIGLANEYGLFRLVGEVSVLGDDFLPTFSGTIGLMGFTGVSNRPRSSLSSATSSVSAALGPRVIDAASEFDAFWTDTGIDLGCVCF